MEIHLHSSQLPTLHHYSSLITSIFTLSLPENINSFLFFSSLLVEINSLNITPTSNTNLEPLHVISVVQQASSVERTYIWTEFQKVQAPSFRWYTFDSTSVVCKMNEAFHFRRSGPSITVLKLETGQYKWNKSALYCTNWSFVVSLHSTTYDAVRTADLLHLGCFLCRSYVQWHGSWTKNCAVRL